MEEWKDRNEGFGGGWGTTTVGGTTKEQRIICHWERTEDKMERTGDIGRLRYMTGGKIIFTEKKHWNTCRYCSVSHFLVEKEHSISWRYP